MPVGRETDCGAEHWTNTQGRTSLNVWSAQCQGHRQRQHWREHKEHTPRVEIDISHQAENRTLAAGLESTDSTDNDMTTDLDNYT